VSTAADRLFCRLLPTSPDLTSHHTPRPLGSAARSWAVFPRELGVFMPRRSEIESSAEPAVDFRYMRRDESMPVSRAVFRARAAFSSKKGYIPLSSSLERVLWPEMRMYAWCVFAQCSRTYRQTHVARTRSKQSHIKYPHLAHRLSAHHPHVTGQVFLANFAFFPFFERCQR
jgi:hypothetical protein